MTTSVQKRDIKSAQISLRIPSALRPVLAQAAALQNMSVSRLFMNMVTRRRGRLLKSMIYKNSNKADQANRPTKIK